MTLEQINELTRIAYHKTAGKYHEHFKNEITQKTYDRLLLDQFLNILRSASMICDAGCGPSGHIGNYLFKKSHKIVLIEDNADVRETTADILELAEYEVITAESRA
ncbi:response regulator [Catalinimonas niigatensis]|uniref:hypothetical protein n=1 Tax=Catalinimonas niigatensis TaxID=1397264 RepID=UPI002665E6E6|nr:hypothetical protein [Catalinimonas niigatensis]WPP51945.1 hypothetical protein PZB72_06045 [Catalinimonas niigatensis]